MCHCRECNGTSILDTIRIFIKLFIAMRADEIIQQIELDVLRINEKLSLDHAIDRAVKKYRKYISCGFLLNSTLTLLDLTGSQICDIGATTIGNAIEELCFNCPQQ